MTGRKKNQIFGKYGIVPPKINKEKESERVSGGSGSRKEKGRGDMDG